MRLYTFLPVLSYSHPVAAVFRLRAFPRLFSRPPRAVFCVFCGFCASCVPLASARSNEPSRPLFDGPLCPSFRTEQADAFSVHVRSRERVGLRREKSLFVFCSAITSALRWRESSPRLRSTTRGRVPQATARTSEWGRSLRCPRAPARANPANSARTHEPRIWRDPIADRGATRRSLLWPWQSADSGHENHIL